MIDMTPNPDGFYDGLYYLTPAERLEALDDPAGFTVAEREEAWRFGRVQHRTAAEAWAALEPYILPAEGGSHV